jgi:site-specific DNA-methyltransferase (adenine-specific)/site-specific DNA-methyltransferase (cytosine-N4-specific)
VNVVGLTVAKAETRTVGIKQVKGDKKNARKRTKRNRDAIAKSLKRFGAGRSIVIDGDDVVRAGNGTIEEATAAGFKEIVVVEPMPDQLVAVKRADWTEEEARAYALADNQSALLAEWDEPMLLDGFDHLPPDVTPQDLGFIESELERLRPKEVVEDDVPESPKTPVTKPGDVWELGRHRVVCGDARTVATAGQVAVAFTSPPYADRRGYGDGFEAPTPAEYVEWFRPFQERVKKAMAADGSWFINIKQGSAGLESETYVFDLVLAHCREWGWIFATEFCWERAGMPGKAWRRFKNGFEPIYQFALGEWKFRPSAVMRRSDCVPVYNKKNRWAHGLTDDTAGDSAGGWAETRQPGAAYPSNRLPVFGTGNETSHTASFPVGLPSFFIKAYSDEGDSVLDPFLGSGTTLIAAEQLDRTCYGIEIEPRYVDVVIERWETLTGGKAKRK